MGVGNRSSKKKCAATEAIETCYGAVAGKDEGISKKKCAATEAIETCRAAGRCRLRKAVRRSAPLPRRLRLGMDAFPFRNHSRKKKCAATEAIETSPWR